MRKPLITVLGIATLVLQGCSTTSEWFPETTNLRTWDVPDWVPWIHVIDVHQGNIITQEKINELRPGMTKRQVRFIMGTPLLQSTFHPDRWDYLYRIQEGAKEAQQFRITLNFHNGSLAGLDGDLRPMSPTEVAGLPKEESQERTVVVPLKPAEDPGFFGRLVSSVGLGDDAPRSAATEVTEDTSDAEEAADNAESTDQPAANN